MKWFIVFVFTIGLTVGQNDGSSLVSSEDDEIDNIFWMETRRILGNLLLNNENSNHEDLKINTASENLAYDWQNIIMDDGAGIVESVSSTDELPTCETQVPDFGTWIVDDKIETITMDNTQGVFMFSNRDCCSYCTLDEDCKGWAFHQTELECVTYSSTEKDDTLAENVNTLYHRGRRVEPVTNSTPPSPEDSVEDESEDPILSEQSQCAKHDKIAYLDRDYFNPNQQKFFDNYQLIINRHFSEDTANETRIDELKTQIITVNEEIIKFTTKLDTQWESIKDLVFPMTKEEWKDQIGFDSILTAWFSEVRTLGIELLQETRTPYFYLVGDLQRYDNEDVGAAICTATDENSITDTAAPVWNASPGSEDIMMRYQEDQQSLKFNYTLSKSVVDNYLSTGTTVETIEQPFFASYKNGSFHYARNFSQSYEFDLSLEVDGGFHTVNVDPGTWYNDAWPEYLRDAIEDDDIFCDVLENGLTSKIKSLFLAKKLSLNVSFSTAEQESILDVFEETSCVRVGPFCSGLACAKLGNVIIGGDDLPDHGGYENGKTYGGWKFIEFGVQTIMENVYHPDKTTGFIAVLGSAYSYVQDVMRYDAGEAIAAVSYLHKYTPYFFEGTDEIDEFFLELEDGFIPNMIYIPGTESQNDLDTAEIGAIKNHIDTLRKYLQDGGGLMAHGPTRDWLPALAEHSIEEVSGCSYSAATVTKEGKFFFPDLEDSHIRSGPCHWHYTNVNGSGLDVLAVDTNGDPFIIGGYGATIGVDQCTTNSTMESVPKVTTEAGKTTISISWNLTTPRIFATFAPRFINSFPECLTSCKNVHANTSISGLDLPEMPIDVEGRDMCCDECAGNSGCFHWMYNENNSTCWLKSDWGNVTETEGYISGSSPGVFVGDHDTGVKMLQANLNNADILVEQPFSLENVMVLMILSFMFFICYRVAVNAKDKHLHGRKIEVV